MHAWVRKNHVTETGIVHQVISKNIVVSSYQKTNYVF